MIWESAPWKQRLLSDADLLTRWGSKTAITERRSFLLEQKCMLAAYTIRKLYEANKLSSSFASRGIGCHTFAAISDRIDAMNSHKFDQLYDLDNPATMSISPRDLVNVIIHSFIFAECVREDLTIEAFLVTSDKKRHDCLWKVGLAEYVRLMRDVGKDYPSSGIRVFDKEANDWRFWQGHGEPPDDVLARFDAVSRRPGNRKT